MKESEKEAIKMFQNLIRANPELIASAGKITRSRNLLEYLQYKKAIDKIMSVNTDKIQIDKEEN